MVAAGNDSVPEGWPPPPGGRGRSRGRGLPFDPKKLLWPVLFLVLVLIAGVAFVTGEGGIIDVADTEVAILINYFTGGEELI
ncbi:MAG: hypothetical protein ABGY15_04725, partial [bacterium]